MDEGERGKKGWHRGRELREKIKGVRGEGRARITNALSSGPRVASSSFISLS